MQGGSHLRQQCFVFTYLSTLSAHASNIHGIIFYPAPHQDYHLNQPDIYLVKFYVDSKQYILMLPHPSLWANADVGVEDFIARAAIQRECVPHGKLNYHCPRGHVSANPS